MTTPAQLSDRELADVLAEAGTACDRADRDAGFFLSASRRRSASAAVIAAGRLRRPLAEEWVLRAAGRATGARVSRVDLVWSPSTDLHAVLRCVLDTDGVDHAGSLTTGEVAVDELTEALRSLCRDWRGQPRLLTVHGVPAPTGIA